MLKQTLSYLKKNIVYKQTSKSQQHNRTEVLISYDFEVFFKPFYNFLVTRLKPSVSKIKY